MNKMGNFQNRTATTKESRTMTGDVIPVEEFKFHDIFEEESSNGLCLGDVYIPEELLTNILSYVPPKTLLHLSLVCKKWCNIIKSECIWMDIYKRHHSRKAKNLPWYVYYCYLATDNFTNLVKNGNGQEKYKHWKILNNFGDQFRIENPPIGSDPLPLGVPEFNGYTSCFATSYYECTKVQEILLKNKLLLRYIMDKFMPHIYISEWVAGRFDCGSRYKLGIRGCGEEYTKGDVFSLYGSDDSPEIIAEFQKSEEVFVEQWKGKEWKKVELLIEGYPCNVTTLLFEHEGQDTQFWKGHYGSKMAGGLIRFAFDSIELLEDTGETKSRRLFKKSDKQ